LKGRYGDPETLNRRWNNAFRRHTYTDCLQIEPPFANGESSVPALRCG
jgi:beta-galactosidase GanA